MAYQATFKRYELKYMLTHEEKESLLRIMEDHMKLDTYGRTTIRNIYFDTPSFQLIRHSIEKPAYKEKLRIRSYCPVKPEDPVFIELKKKYKSIVYKRRLTVPNKLAISCFQTGRPLPVESQISDEVEYFRKYYHPLKPSVVLSYEREAYYALDGSDFRVTFDENILYRNDNFSLSSEIYGFSLLENGCTLMEIKTSGGMPLWMTHALTDLQIFKTSFSKYGTAYRHMIERGRRLEEERRTIYAS